MTGDLDVRRRRAAYRATHRGTKEMDWLLGRFAEAQAGGFDHAKLEAFERFLELPDPDLQDWIMQGPDRAITGRGHSGLSEEFETFITQIRAFHRLGSPTR